MNLALLLCLAALLAACGQKGDLYLPSSNREPVITVPTDAGANPPAATEDDDAATGNAAQPAPRQ